MASNESELSQLLEALPGLVWTALPDGHAEFVSQRWCEFTGMKSEEIVGFGWRAAIHPYDLPIVLERWQALVEAGKPGDIEARLRRHDGKYRWFRFSCAAIRDRTGQIIKWCGVNVEIEELVHAQQLTLQVRQAELDRSSREPASGQCGALDGLDLRQMFRVVTSGGVAKDLGGGGLADDASDMSRFFAAFPDIAASRISEIQLRATLYQLNEAQRLSRTCSFTVDPVANVHVWSKEFYRIAEIEPGTVVRRETFQRMVLPQDRKILDQIEAATKRGIESDFVFRIKTGSGAVKHVRGIARLACEIDERPIFIGALQDVTEYKLAEDALRASEAELRLANLYLAEAQRLSQTGSFTWDALADEENWSAEVYRILQLDPTTEVKLSLIRQLVHPADLPLLEAAIERGLAGLDMDLTARVVTPAGVVKHLHVVAHRIANIVDRPVFVGAIQDVTASKLAQETIAASERDLRLIVDSIPGMVAIFSASGQLESVNPQILQYFGGSFDECKDWAVRGHVHPEDSPHSVETFSRAITSGEPFELECRARRHDGSYRWFQSRGTPLKDSSGRIVRWYNLLIDIDDRKRAEDALKASEAAVRRTNQFLTMAQELSQTGSFSRVIATDEQHLSDQMYRIWEFDTAQKVTQAMVVSRIHPEDLPRFESAWNAALEGPTGLTIGYRIVPGSGAVKHLRTICRPELNALGQLVFVGATQDVTEIWRVEDAANRAREELAHVARVSALSALTASIAHEVNQPLAGIMTNADICLRMLDIDPPDLDEARATARRTLRDGTRASEVIRRLRALFARKEPSREMVDLRDATHEILALSASKLQAASVSVQTNFPENLPDAIGDRVQLQQVILNLVLNAVDAMREVDQRPRILLLAGQTETERIIFSVCDNGVGLAQNGYEKLFDTFYTTKPQGMGIGLSISRSIVERHEGRIWATPNRDGPGTTFWFEVPHAPTHSDENLSKLERGHHFGQA